jgi:hypothetical protein
LGGTSGLLGTMSKKKLSGQSSNWESVRSSWSLEESIFDEVLPSNGTRWDLGYPVIVSLSLTTSMDGSNLEAYRETEAPLRVIFAYVRGSVYIW